MATLNADIPVFEALVRREFLHDLQSHQGEVEPVAVFGLASVPGRILAFHVMTQTGAQFARIPLHALCWKHPAPLRQISDLQLWDCYSEEVSVHRFAWLEGKRCKIIRSQDRGVYLFTVDWWTDTAKIAGDLGHKNAHVVRLDDGNFAALPNNRLVWADPAWVTKPIGKPTYLTNTHDWQVERREMPTEDSNAYFYEPKGNPDAPGKDCG